jgi:VWFA-related protein
MKPLRFAFASLLFASLLVAQVKDGSPVTILATVSDGRGRPRGDLQQQDFELREDGKDVRIESISTFKDKPSSVGMIVDVSGSMKPKLARASNAIEDFGLGLPKDDEIFLMPFADSVKVIVDYTDTRPDFTREVRRLQAYGETALYDAINEGVRKLKQGHYDRKVLLIVTDGADSVSGISYNQIARILRESNVIVYGLGIPAGFGSALYAPSNNFAPQIVLGGGNRQPGQIQIPNPNGRPIPIPLPGQPMPLPSPTKNPDDTGDTVNMSVLEAFANMTGGKAWRVEDPQRRIGQPIDRILGEVLSELRNQYFINFVPQHRLKDGEWHSVLIRTKELGLSVRTRKEYVGK